MSWFFERFIQLYSLYAVTEFESQEVKVRVAVDFH